MGKILFWTTRDNVGSKKNIACNKSADKKIQSCIGDKKVKDIKASEYYTKRI